MDGQSLQLLHLGRVALATANNTATAKTNSRLTLVSAIFSSGPKGITETDSSSPGYTRQVYDTRSGKLWAEP